MSTAATRLEVAPTPRVVAEQVVEIVSDSGEGAQTAGQIFGTISAKMGNGVWTVEIIPAEIEPPPRSRAGASGIRIRFASRPVTNMGDHADLVVAFNEQVLYSRIDQGALRPGTVVLLESRWARSKIEDERDSYRAALKDFRSRGFDVREIPMEEQTLTVVDNARKGKNTWVLGMLCALYGRDLEHAKSEITGLFTRKRKGDAVVQINHRLLEAGYAWGVDNLPERFEVPAEPDISPKLVLNGNAAIALGAMAAGIELCSMYPITPATSVAHYLSSMFHRTGGFVHQAEDEIAAVGFAIGASYAGKTAMTVTSGPGMALKTELIGLAVMAEIPLVIVDVQRGGPSTGLPTKVEQSDLLSSLFGHPGDSPKVVIAPSTIEECFSCMVLARQIAETFRTPVIVLTDANLATGQAPIPYPDITEANLSPPVDQSPWQGDVPPYAWDPATGVSRRPIPGQEGGEYVLTGLEHDEHSHIAYDAAVHQRASAMRSRKLAALRKTLKPPEVYGGDKGELLVVGWGSTRGAIEEAVDRLRAEGLEVSSVHLRFLSPLEPGLSALLRRFDHVMTVELNYSDDPADVESDEEGTRRLSQLAFLLRATTLCDVGCWSRVPGQPLPPGEVAEGVREYLKGVR